MHQFVHAEKGVRSKVRFNGSLRPAPHVETTVIRRRSRSEDAALKVSETRNAEKKETEMPTALHKGASAHGQGSFFVICIVFFFSFIFNLFSFDSVDSVQQSPRRNEWKEVKASAFSGLVGKVPVRWPRGFKGLGRMGSWVAVRAWEGRSACACVLVACMWRWRRYRGWMFCVWVCAVFMDVGVSICLGMCILVGDCIYFCERRRAANV